MTDNKFIDSPCIGFCSTTYGDDYCKGCYRHFDQVIQWEQLSFEEKKIFYKKISEIIKPLVTDYLELECKEQFAQGCKVYNVTIQSDLPIEYHMYQLLQKASIKLHESPYGLRKKSNYSWSELYSLIDKRIYTEVGSL